MKSLTRFIKESMINEQVPEPCSLETMHRLFDERFRNYNIESIPLELRKKAIQNDYAKIREMYWKSSWQFLDNPDLPDEEPIFEDLADDIISTQTVIKDLQEKYGLADYQFEAIHPYKVQYVKVTGIPNYMVTSSSVLMPEVKENVEIIIKEMKKAGYYKVREYTYHDNRLKCRWIAMMFDPIRQDDIATQVRNHIDYVYHFTPVKNHQSIIENGIVPRNEGRTYTYYQDRVYLVLTSRNSKEFHRMIKNVSSNRKNNDSSFDGRFMVYQIDLSLLPKTMKFYYDPHGANCVYTTETIPYSAISKEEEIQV